MIVFYILGVVLSLFLNFMVVAVIFSKRLTLRHLDLIMLSLAISDVIQACLGYSIEIYAHMSGNVISNVQCQISGYTITFMALVSITHLVGMSMERFLLSTFPMKFREWFSNRRSSLYIIVPSWIYGFMWASFPLFGWSRYTREKNARQRCSIDLSSSTIKSRSYAFSLFLFCFILPIIIILTCSIIILRVLKKMTRQASVLGLREHHTGLRRRREIKHTLMTFVLIAVFLVTWSPYASCTFVLTIHGEVQTILLTLSALFAKTSTLWNPIIYTIFLTDFRRRCLCLILCRPTKQTRPASTMVSSRVNSYNTTRLIRN